MRSQVVKVGHVLMVELPDSFCQQTGVVEGAPIDLDLKGDQLTIRPVRFGVGDLIARIKRPGDAPGAPSGPGGGEKAEPEKPAIQPAKVRTRNL
jgi:antitoxin component of MazEF toxin-antitoxin module